MFKKTILDNDLTVVSYKLPHAHSVSINLLVKVGARYENLLENGISHFLEHMAFKGTKNRSAQKIAEEFDNIGGSFNAYTSSEFTVYQAKSLLDDYPLALEIIIDIIENSLFENTEITKELEVIRQEINASQDNPDDLVYELLHKTAFGDNNSFGRPILGTYDNIKKFTKEDFVKYVEKYYNAANIIISIAGNIDHEDVVENVKRLSKFLPTIHSSFYEKAKYYGGAQTLYKDLEQSNIMIGFQTSGYKVIADNYMITMLSILFGGGISSRLFQNIREQQGLCYSVGSYVNTYNDIGLFTIYASSGHDKINILVESLAVEVHKLIDNITIEELKRTKAQITSQIKMAQENVNYISESVAKIYAIHEKYLDYEKILNEYILPISVSDLRDAAIKIFAKPPSVALVGDKTVKIDYDSIKNKFNK